MPRKLVKRYIWLCLSECLLKGLTFDSGSWVKRFILMWAGISLGRLSGTKKWKKKKGKSFSFLELGYSFSLSFGQCAPGYRASESVTQTSGPLVLRPWASDWIMPPFFLDLRLFGCRSDCGDYFPPWPCELISIIFSPFLPWCPLSFYIISKSINILNNIHIHPEDTTNTMFH